MRKVLSIVLALAMVLGCFASVFAAEFTDVKADDDFATAVSVLSDLSVVSGYNDGTYKPEKVVTRAEMAALIVKALGLTPAASATTNFSDVPATHWASGYVAYANSLGVIAGYTDGTFKPSKTVSYDEALTMIVSALGFTADSLEGTTWPTAYVMKAQTLGITDDVTVLGSAGANRADIAQMLYNTLDQAIGKTNKDGDFTENKEGKDTMFARLGASEPKSIVVDKDTASAIDLSEYFGAEVKAICNKDGKVLAVASVTTEFLTGEYTGTKIGSTAVLSGAFTTSSAIYLNGALSGKNAPATGSTYTFAVKYNSDGDVKTVVSTQSWLAADTKKVSADVKAGATKIEGIALPTKTVNGKAVLDTTKFELVGVDSIEAIKKNNIVTYYEADGAVVKVEVGTEVVTGKITKVASGKATINGTAYAAATGYTFPADFTNEYDFFLNYAGKVFASAQVTSETTKSYGILVDFACTETPAEWSSTGSDKTFQAKIYTTEGKEVVYTVEEGTVKLDGIPLADKTSLNADLNKLVAYELDEDGYLVTLAKVTGVDAKNKTVNAKLVLDAKYFADDAVVFTYDYDAKTGYEWSIGSTAKLAKVTLGEANSNGAYYELNKAGSKIAYLVMAVAAEAKDAVVGIYTGEAQVGTSKCEVYFMVDGAEVTYEKAAATSGFTFTGEANVITFIGSAPSTLVDTTAKTGKLAITSKAALSGNTFTADGTTFYALDADVLVYFVDKDKNVTVGSTDDMIDTSNTSVALYCTTATATDNVFEVVVVFEK